MKRYSYLEKIMHRQFLGDNPFSNYLFERNFSKSSSQDSISKSNDIFITGLARSGTTALLNKIYSSGEVGSLLYKFMPFILYPELSNYFHKVSNNKKNIFMERFHKDGIKININSPECLDEVFWIKAHKNEYKKSFLVPFQVDQNTLEAYCYLIKKFEFILLKNRMVIKNNNNHLRLESLVNCFTSCYFIFTYRDPIYQAFSLLNQHLNFIKLKKKDEFILEYMNLIGHFEFGLGLKSFNYYEKDNYFKNKDRLNINYWLEQWIKTHKWVLNKKLYKNKNLIIISYEDLCYDYKLYKKLCEKIKIKNNHSGVPFKLANKIMDLDICKKDLLKTAKEIYEELKFYSLN